MSENSIRNQGLKTRTRQGKPDGVPVRQKQSAVHTHIHHPHRFWKKQKEVFVSNSLFTYTGMHTTYQQAMAT
jgi:hypothetical protein